MACLLYNDFCQSLMGGGATSQESTFQSVTHPVHHTCCLEYPSVVMSSMTRISRYMLENFQFLPPMNGSLPCGTNTSAAPCKPRGSFVKCGGSSCAACDVLIITIDGGGRGAGRRQRQRRGEDRVHAHVCRDQVHAYLLLLYALCFMLYVLRSSKIDHRASKPRNPPSLTKNA